LITTEVVVMKILAEEMTKKIKKQFQRFL